MKTMRPSLRLASADNFRDLAGEGVGYATRTGRMRRGVFYRSNHLVLTAGDAESVGSLGLAHVRDLRESDELERWPDVQVSGATWGNFVMQGIVFSSELDGDDPAAVHDGMAAGYRRFVSDAGNSASLGRLLREMALGRGPEVFHCASGKDRTGWVAALLHHIAGVDRETVVHDYLLSNGNSRASREQMTVYVAERYGPEKVAVLEPSFVVSADYLNAGLDLAGEMYGDLDGYIAHGLGVSSEQREALRVRLTT
jgi:protein-tyrosine phosphatase